MPGSNASDSTEIFAEGLRIPALKLYEAGRPNETLFRIITKNVRVPDMVLGDMASQVAGARSWLAVADRNCRTCAAAIRRTARTSKTR